MKTKIKLPACLLAGLLTGCVSVTKTDEKFSITRLGGATTFQGASYNYTSPNGETQTLILDLEF